jgi:hypothetical protein
MSSDLGEMTGLTDRQHELHWLSQISPEEGRMSTFLGRAWEVDRGRNPYSLRRDLKRLHITPNENAS